MGKEATAAEKVSTRKYILHIYVLNVTEGKMFRFSVYFKNVPITISDLCLIYAQMPDHRHGTVFNCCKQSPSVCLHNGTDDPSAEGYMLHLTT